MKNKTFKTEIGGRDLNIEIGQFANQANGSCIVKYGETTILATAVMNKEPREGISFFPLMVEYSEKMYAAGRIKGSRFIKREGRPTDEAVLTGRMIDRGLRPLFDQTLRNDVQVIITVLAIDEENDPDIPAIIGAATALTISDIPFNGPVGGIRVGRINNEWVINPTYEARKKSELDLTLTLSEDKVLMVESSANEVDEEIVLEAFKFGLKHNKKVLKLITEIQKKVGKEKIKLEKKSEDEESEEKISQQELENLEKETKEFLTSQLDKHLFSLPKGSKKERKEAINKLKEVAEDFLKEKQIGKDRRKKVLKFFYKFIDEQITNAVLEKDQRVDGRKLDEIRDLECEVSLFERLHGSGLFNRGETQVMSIVTLGSPGDEQTLDGMEVTGKKRYMHHYNFPPFAVGEASPIRGTGRREIGHGALAEKALLPVLPEQEEFPYTIRVVSEVLGSNGSSSMASTCGSTLALMDAGVPIKRPVAGIAIGLASNENMDFKILTDIQDLEDGTGGMDFKVTGTTEGFTAIQMDTKTNGLTIEIVEGALKAGRLALGEILKEITKCIPEPNKELSQYAPRIESLRIDPEKIRVVIGAGGKTINEIIDTTGVAIDIEDDGLVMITSTSADGIKEAIEWIKNLTKEAKVGEVYVGKITKLMDFGAFVEIFPGTEGMVHISEIAEKRINNINDVLKEGQEVKVKVIKIDPVNGKIGLSIKRV